MIRSSYFRGDVNKIGVFQGFSVHFAENCIMDATSVIGGWLTPYFKARITLSEMQIQLSTKKQFN